MTPEFSHACALIVEAHEAAELAVAITYDAYDKAPDHSEAEDLAWLEHQDAQTILDAIAPAVRIARQAMERDALRSSHPAARALRGVQ